MVRNSNLKGSVLNSTSDKIVSHEKKHRHHMLVWICCASLSLQVWALGLPSPCEARPRLLEGRQ